ncbi:MAG: biopolymer transporter ExbD [Pirellulaceae bacterium]|nr:biopolymer transporter ExbD [Planctomycetales bacterium]
MRIRNTRKLEEEQIELQMTPMIDIVFQLLVFFVMTFKVVAQEGDFNIKMPLASESTGIPEDQPLPPMRLVLRSDDEGNLAGISLNDQPFTNFREVNEYVRSLIGDSSGPNGDAFRDSAEIEIDSDYLLKYSNVIAAVTAVTGYVDQNDKVVKLVEKIKFAPPKPAPAQQAQ